MMEAGAVKRVAVLGAGTIGGSWVAWFLARGMQVTVWIRGRRQLILCSATLPTLGPRWRVWA
jgi:3-hydroxyacyl-CoA dehydrogenase